MNHPDTESRSVVDRKLLAIFNGLNGFGQILLFWTLTTLELGGIVLLIIGIININWIPFFFGLISLRLYLYFVNLNRESVDKMSPFDG